MCCGFLVTVLWLFCVSFLMPIHFSVLKKNLQYMMGKKIKYNLINELWFFSMVASENLTVLFCSLALKHSRRHMCMHGAGKTYSKETATQIQLLALILLSLLSPLKSLITLIPLPIYNIVEEESHLYIFSVLALVFGVVAVVCGYRNNSW